VNDSSLLVVVVDPSWPKATTRGSVSPSARKCVIGFRVEILPSPPYRLSPSTSRSRRQRSMVAAHGHLDRITLARPVDAPTFHTRADGTTVRRDLDDAAARLPSAAPPCGSPAPPRTAPRASAALSAAIGTTMC
jgi:hypothetical protein